jgi:hypothetical protein
LHLLQVGQKRVPENCSLQAGQMVIEIAGCLPRRIIHPQEQQSEQASQALQ